MFKWPTCRRQQVKCLIDIAPLAPLARHPASQANTPVCAHGPEPMPEPSSQSPYHRSKTTRSAPRLVCMRACASACRAAMASPRGARPCASRASVSAPASSSAAQHSALTHAA
eukprot:6175101-Pleurochrysis_carterae.AAC.1